MNKKAKDILNGVFGLFYLISLPFMVIAGIARVEGMIDWSWFWILAPLWVLPSVVIVLLVALFCVVFVVSFVQTILGTKKVVGKYKWRVDDQIKHNGTNSERVGKIKKIKKKVVYVSYEGSPFDIGYPAHNLDEAVDKGRITKIK